MAQRVDPSAVEHLTRTLAIAPSSRVLSGHGTAGTPQARHKQGGASAYIVAIRRVCPDRIDDGSAHKDITGSW
jgi:hypothetical protein